MPYASIVAVTGPPIEAPNVCWECSRRAAGTQELHPGEDLGGKNEEQGDRQQHS